MIQDGEMLQLLLKQIIEEINSTSSCPSKHRCVSASTEFSRVGGVSFVGGVFLCWLFFLEGEDVIICISIELKEPFDI